MILKLSDICVVQYHPVVQIYFMNDPQLLFKGL